MDQQLKSVNILGVRVDKVTMDQSVSLVEEWVREEGKPACRQAGHFIVTPNPEFIMAAQKDSEFKEVLNQSDLAIPDGTRLGWASKILSEKNWLKRFFLMPLFLFPLKQLIQFDTVPGVDLMEELIRMSAERGFTVGFLGGQKGVAEKTAECLQKKYQNLRVAFAGDGGKVDRMGNGASIMYRGKKEEKLIEPLIPACRQARLNTNPIPQVDILFVAFGQIKQEKWIAKNLPNIPVKVMMGVGGSFDYLSGNVLRAPKFMRNLGLEWLFRLILQPWRIKRQLSLIKFAWQVICHSESVN